MSFQWKCNSVDGFITRLDPVSKENPFLLCSVGDKPRETAKCMFKINSSNLDLASEMSLSSYYLKYIKNSNILYDTLITTVIGLRSMTNFDRLIDTCLMKMICGETAKFSFKFGNMESVVELTMISFGDAKELFDMSLQELINIAARLKTDGVTLYFEKKVMDAFHKFSKAFKYLTVLDDHSLQKEASNSTLLETKRKMLCTLQCNLAGCHVQNKNWESAIDLCTQVLAVEPDNFKALFRRGTSLVEIQEFDRARQDFNLLIELQPNNSTFKQKLALVDEKEKVINLKYAAAMRKMFDPEK